MSCLINSGYSLGCRDNLGGIQKVFVRNWSASTTYTYDANGVITGGTNTGTSFYTFEQRNETAEFIPGEGQHSLENGTNFWNQNVNLVFHKYQASLRDLLYVIAQTEVEIIVLDQNGKYFIVGEQNGANLIGSNASVGKAFGDLNGVTVNFQAKEPGPAREINSTFIGTLTFV
jgi:hypothetical protein